MLNSALSQDWNAHSSSDGVLLHYSLLGPPDAPVIVLCNGIGASTLAWKWIVDLPGYRFFVWHYRGSTPEPAPLDLRLQRHAHDALELIEHLELRVHALMGWSMGVGVAAWIAAKLPQSPLLIFLSGCHIRPQRKVLGLRAAWYVLEPGVALAAALPDPINHISRRIVRRIGRSSRARSAFIETFIRLRCLNHTIDRNHFSQLLKEWFQADMKTISRQLLEVCKDLGPGDQLLQALDNPVLIVAGEHDPMVHVTLSLEFAELFSQAECYVHPHATHFMIFEYPQELARVLITFLGAAHSPRST